jgi:hypothetical protein
MKKTLSSLVLGLALTMGAVQLAHAKGGNKYHAYNLTGESIGLGGYDPVSYFPEGGGKPQKGLYDITAEYDGVTWRFITKENQALFKKSPEKYLPAFGGWCAFAVGGENLRFDADPTNYLIKDGKVYVFYRDPKNDTKALWEKDADNLYKKAQENWPKLSK